MNSQTRKLILICVVTSVLSSIFTIFIMYRFTPGGIFGQKIEVFDPSNVSKYLPQQTLDATNRTGAQPPMIPPLPPQPMMLKADVCDEDLKRYCVVFKDLSSREICLDQNFFKLSPDCKKRYERVRNNYSPCLAEIKKYCAQESYGAGKMMKCLAAQGPKLSPSCKAFVGY
jgi:hypothetical protein